MVSTWFRAAVITVGAGTEFAACSGDLPGTAHATAPLAAAAAAPAVAAPTAAALPDFTSLVERYGPAPRAFLVVPMVGAFFIDFTNGLIITAFLNLFK